MVVLRESGGCQPISKDTDEVLTFKFFHGGKLVKNRKDNEWSYLGGEVSWFDYCEVDYMSMLELFGMAKDLGYDDGNDVSFYDEEFGTGRLIQIISNSSLLSCISTVPKSNSRVIVLYLKVASLTSSQVGNDSSDQEYSCSEDDDSSDPDFEDSDYAQSDEEIDLLKKDDKWFEGYVDHSCIDNDPNAEENDESDNGEESPTLTCPNSSSSEDDAIVHQDYGYRPSRATVYKTRAIFEWNTMLHACAAISWFHGNPKDFCDTVYKKETYLRGYEPMIMPITSQDQWMKINLPPLLPSKYHKQPGRPKKTRKQAVDEPKQPANPYKLPRYGIPLKCGNCCGKRHNRISSKEPRNPNIKPTRQRKVAKDKLAVSEVADASQSQPSQATDASQSQPSQATDASQSQPSQASDASQSQPSQASEPAKLFRVQ
ncbi:unnamed protein product [Prunus armeniaca]